MTTELNSRQQQALAYFVRMGWTLAQAAGIVANLTAESNLNPAAVGDNGAAYGIAQWHGDRQAGFHALLGRPIQGSSLEDQLAWVHAEMRSTERVAGAALAACTTAAEAGACVSEKYERPADRAGEAIKRGILAENILAVRGEEVAQPPEHVAEPPQLQGAQMDPMSLLAVFGPVIAQLIPQVGQLFGGQKDKQNVEVVGKIFDTIVQATGQTGPADMGRVGAAIRAMQTNSTVKKSVTEAVVTHPEIIGLLEVGGGIKEARAASLAIQTSDKPFWYSPMFWISAAFFPMMYLIVASVLFTVQPAATPLVGAPWWAMVGFDQATRSGLVNLIVGMVFGGVVGVWFGTSYGSQRKTELAAVAEQTAAK